MTVSRQTYLPVEVRVKVKGEPWLSFGECESRVMTLKKKTLTLNCDCRISLLGT